MKEVAIMAIVVWLVVGLVVGVLLGTLIPHIFIYGWFTPGVPGG